MAFPTTSVLDDFNRADGTINGSGIWASGGVWGGSDMQVVSNRAGRSSSGQGDARTTASYSRATNGLEVYATIHNLGFTSQETFIFWCLANVGSGTCDGYGLRYSSNNDTIRLTRIDNDSQTQLYITGNLSPNFSPGNKIGIQHDADGTIHVMYYSSGAWAELTTVVDTTYTSGYFGMCVAAAIDDYLDDFGGGEIAGGGGTTTRRYSLSLTGVG